MGLFDCLVKDEFHRVMALAFCFEFAAFAYLVFLACAELGE